MIGDIDRVLSDIIFNPVRTCERPGCNYVLRVSNAEPRKVPTLIIIGMVEHYKAAHPEGGKAQ